MNAEEECTTCPLEAPFCYEHNCNGYQKYVCDDCHTRCVLCEKAMCDNCLANCDSCKKSICTNCRLRLDDYIWLCDECTVENNDHIKGD